MPDWQAMAMSGDQEIVQIGMNDLGFLYGVASLALEFCREPETYPVFARWLEEYPGRPPALSRDTLKTADMVITEISHRMFGGT